MNAAKKIQRGGLVWMKNGTKESECRDTVLLIALADIRKKKTGNWYNLH